MPEVYISKDKSKINIDTVYQFLSHSYWASNRSLQQIEKSIQNSICYGVYIADKQIGFARVITDLATYAYIADVFVLKKHRGNGYSKKLMTEILNDDTLKDVSTWYLVTKDAQGLYQQFGFVEQNDPQKTVMHIPSFSKTIQ